MTNTTIRVSPPRQSVFPGVTAFRYSLLFLSPLLYSFDQDPFRAYEVLAVAMASFFLLQRGWMGTISWIEPALVFGYASFLVLQQGFVQNGSFIFGAKFFVTTVCVFVPYWLLAIRHQNSPHLTVGIKWGIDALLILCAASMLVTFALGIGESYGSGVFGGRIFSWLGDSFTPVFVFLFLFYALERRVMFALVAFGLLLLTGGKSGILMAAVAVLIYAVIFSRSLVPKLAALFAAGVILVIPVDYLSLTDNLQNFSYSYNNRIFSFQVGLQYFSDHPVFGIGINRGLEMVPRDADQLAASLGVTEYFPVYQIQNAFIRSLAETGIVGFSFLVLLCIVWIRRATLAVLACRQAERSTERSIAIASALWVIAFITAYQTTGWFLAGHPQLSWLICFSTLTIIFARRVK